MSKEELITLQFHHQESGKTLKEYLKEIGVGYSTYNYWRKKFVCEEEPHELAPISFRTGVNRPAEPLQIPKDMPTGACSFPNGLRAHFGAGTEDMLMELFEKSLASHVLP